MSAPPTDSSMAGRTMVVTGGTGGIGIRTAIGLARKGARMLITGRNKERGDEAVQQIMTESGNQDVVFVKGDVSSAKSIDFLASEIMEKAPVVDALINNAGYMGNDPATSEDGLEMHFAVNVFAPWRLVHSLLPALRASSSPRVVNVTGGDQPEAIDLSNLQAEKGFRGLMTYQHSKSIQECMSMALAEKMKSEKVMVHVVFPGRASTEMTRNLNSNGLPGWMKLCSCCCKLMFRDDGGKGAALASRSSIFAATDPELAKVTGKFFDTNSKEMKLHPTAYDPKVQAAVLAVIDKVPLPQSS